METLFIVLASIVGYAAVARITSRIILSVHINDKEPGCTCTIQRMSEGCFNENVGGAVCIGGAFWPLALAGVILYYGFNVLVKIVDFPIILLSGKFEKKDDDDDSPKQTRAIRKANERLELAKIHEQEALALEAAFTSNVRLLEMKEAFNPLHIKA